MKRISRTENNYTRVTCTAEENNHWELARQGHGQTRPAQSSDRQPFSDTNKSSSQLPQNMPSDSIVIKYDITDTLLVSARKSLSRALSEQLVDPDPQQASKAQDKLQIIKLGASSWREESLDVIQPLLEADSLLFARQNHVNGVSHALLRRHYRKKNAPDLPESLCVYDVCVSFGQLECTSTL